MALLATFIGIDKYADPSIRELPGAYCDAVALWALFSDTLPDIQPSLLTGKEATTEAVRRSLDATLNAATPKDTVVITYAGHGTRDHRITAYDTAKDSYLDTTIPMAELAQKFRESKAKCILCILDCCFSGGATARVLDYSPVSRDSEITLETLAGKGRILIAASNINEVAYEQPGSGHGLLTKALLDVLQASDETINLTGSMDQVMACVRAEAAKIGVVQTPVFFGYVEGGLTLPSLRPGKNFFLAFPDARGVKVSHDLDDLAQLGLPPSVLGEWKSRLKHGLNDLQLQAVNEYRILDGESLLVVAPTSSGKTFIGEMAAVRAITDSRKAVFLLPYKALVNEKFDQFSHMYGTQLGIRVIRCTGDRLDGVDQFVKGKYDIALLTYEMFLGLCLGNPAVLNLIGLVVLDEAQFITDPNRGIIVELLLTHLLAAREKGVSPQLITLSAVIGSINSFDEWLNCKKLVTNQRPVPLVEGVLDRNGTFQYLDPSGNVRTTQLIPRSSIIQRTKAPSAQDVIVPLVKSLLQKNDKEQVIVFRNRKGPAEGCAAYLANELGLPGASEAIAGLPAYDLSTSAVKLRGCLEGGTAFHNTNLIPEEKEVVERSFRDPTGKVRVLGATTTVAAGINTPASTVILAEQEFVGEDGRPFTVAEYKNMAGRAGRLGFNEEGRAIILANNEYEREQLFHKYVQGELEPLRSSFDPQEIETWVLRLLAQVGQIQRSEVIRLLANTYGGFIAVKQHPDWHEKMKERLDALIQEMISLGIIEEEGSVVRLSLLGQICGKSSLSFVSVVRLIHLLRSVQHLDITAEGLVALVQGLPELDRIYTPLMKSKSKAGTKIVQSETGWPRDAARRYGNDVVGSLQRNADSFFEYYARCKRALILGDWVQGVPLETIEQRYTASPFYAVEYGNIRSIADATRFHLRAANQIATVILIDKGPDETQVESLLKQLEVGIPRDGLELLAIPGQLTRGEYMALYNAGIKTGDEFWLLPQNRVSELLGETRAKLLDTLRP
jgi:helicase